MSLVRAALNAFEVTDRRWAYLDDVIIRGGDVEVHSQRVQRMPEVQRRCESEQDLGGSCPHPNSAKCRERATLIIRHAVDPGEVCQAPAWHRPRTERNLQTFPELVSRRQDEIKKHEPAECQPRTVNTIWKEELENNVDGLGMASKSAAREMPRGESAGAESASQFPSPDGSGRGTCPRTCWVAERLPESVPVRGNQPRLIRTLRRMCMERTTGRAYPW